MESPALLRQVLGYRFYMTVEIYDRVKLYMQFNYLYLFSIRNRTGSKEVLPRPSTSPKETPT